MTEKIQLAVKLPGEMYAIRNKGSCLFSRGGAGPKWGKFPKTWAIGPFKNHLHLFGAHGWEIGQTYSKEELDRYYWNKNDTKNNYGKYLIPKNWPYYQCEVVKFDLATLTIQEQHDAEEWVWFNVYLPALEKEKRYWPRIQEFCKNEGINLR